MFDEYGERGLILCERNFDLKDEMYVPFEECDRLQEFPRQLTYLVTLETQLGINPATTQPPNESNSKDQGIE